MQRFIATAFIISVIALGYLAWTGYFDNVDWLGIFTAAKPRSQ